MSGVGTYEIYPCCDDDGGAVGPPAPDSSTTEGFDQPAVGDSIAIETVGPLSAIPGMYLDFEVVIDGTPSSSTYEVLSTDPGDLNVINARLVDAGTIAPGTAVPSGATLKVAQLAEGQTYVANAAGYAVPLTVDTAPVVYSATLATEAALPAQRQAVVDIEAAVVTEVEQPLPAAPLVGDRVVLSRGSNVTSDLLVTPPLGYTIAGLSEYRLPKTPQANAVLQYMGGNKWRLLAGANGGASSSDTRAESWIPDTMVWDNTGVAAQRRRGPIWRLGNVLYQFGGINAAGAATDKIFTAAWPGDSGNVPAFVDSGAVLPFAANGARICLIDNTLWMIGAQDNEQRICSAPVATPLVWTNTGTTIGERRDNAGFVLTSTRIGLITGHSGGGGYNTVRYTSIATPTAGWATSAAVMAVCWESAAGVFDGKVCSFGGFNENNVNRWTSEATFPTGAWNSAVTSHPTTNSAEVIDLGDHSFHVGSGATPQWWALPVRAPVYGAAEYVTSTVDLTYLNGASWIGGDGRIYVVSSEAGPQFGRIWRSGRRKVYVDAAQVAGAGPYDALRGVTADGAPAIVSAQMRMANKPWLTNRRDVY